MLFCRLATLNNRAGRSALNNKKAINKKHL
nr:MAG TPA: hypothetical protein [Caudoviricetes sp.]